MVIMSESDSENAIIEQVKKDNLHFKALLDLVPAHLYFSQEDKLEIFGTSTGDFDDEDQDGQETKTKRYKFNPFTTMSVTEIIELREKGGMAGVGKQNSKSANAGVDASNTAGIVEKQKGKKLSRHAKGNKNKGKEIERRGARVEELKDKLSQKLEEIKAKRNLGNALTSQEIKKLKRQQKKVSFKLKNTNKNIKEQKIKTVAEALKTSPQKKNPILNQNGEKVKSKFDFSVSFDGDSARSSNFRGRDYKRLLEKVEKRKEKVEKLKENDLEAGKKLETKFQWQAALIKAKGEKVKDDETLLKKAAKRKDKVKDKKKRKWDDRVKTVDELKQKRQQKRQANLDKRKGDKKDKKRKKMIKKGRIIPGF